MPGQILTTMSQIKCTHGGTAMLTTANTKLTIAGAPALLESDVHTVVGCSFMIGTKYSPCVKIEWTAGAAMTKSGGTKVLIKTSVGKCVSGEGATQGMAMIASTQMKTSAM